MKAWTKDQLTTWVKAQAKTQADIVNLLAQYLGMVGYYALGEEPLWRRWGRVFTPFPNDGDCSGTEYSLMRMASEISVEMGLGPIVWANDTPWPRLTANGYNLASLLAYHPYRTNDCVFTLIKWGHGYHATHIAMLMREVDGVWQTFESAGGRMRWSTLPKLLAKRGRREVRRFVWLDLGPVTLPRPLTKGMVGDDVEHVQVRLNEHLGPFVPVTRCLDDATLAGIIQFKKLRAVLKPYDGNPTFATLQALETAPYFPTLRRGSWGRYVGHMKRLLNRQGESFLVWDFRFGPREKTAIERFQLTHNLCSTGVCNGPTWNALLA